MQMYQFGACVYQRKFLVEISTVSLSYSLSSLDSLSQNSRHNRQRFLCCIYKSSRLIEGGCHWLPLAVTTDVNMAIVDDNRRVFSAGRKKTARSLTKCTAANRVITAASDFSTHALFFFFPSPPSQLPKETSRSISDNDATDITPPSSSRALYSFSRYRLPKTSKLRNPSSRLKDAISDFTKESLRLNINLNT